MSPLLTDFAGVSIYALGFARGGAADKYFIATGKTANTTYSSSVSTNATGTILWGFYEATAAKYYLAPFSADGTVGTIYGGSIYNTAIYFGNAKITSTGDWITSWLQAAGQGYLQPTKISAGTIQWQRRIGYYSVQNGVIDFDTSGNIYSVSMVNGGWNNTGYMANLVKYNSSGTIQWQKAYTLAGNSWSKSDDLAVAASGNGIYITASYSTSNTPNTSGLAKINTDGTVAWARNSSSTSSGNPGTRVCSDANDNAIITDQNRLAKYNSSGTYQWAINYGSSYQNTDVAADPSGNVYIARSDNTNLYVVKFNSSGTVQWQRSIALASGNLYLGTSVNTDGRKSITASATAVTIAASTGSKAVLFKLPLDGSITGAYVADGGTYTIAASSQTFSSGSDIFSSVSLTANNGGGTDVANNISLSSQTPTMTTKVIP